MMQNKLSFHQSSVSLEIIGLPDYSNNENKDQISIISQWKLTIVDKPLIEGKIEHLGPIMDAFYIYSNLLIKNEIPIYESKLIDIKADNLHIHNIVLKSSKANVKPLVLKIGNSLLSDTINCFDQLNESPKVRIKKSYIPDNMPNKFRFGLNKKVKIFNFFIVFINISCWIIFNFWRRYYINSKTSIDIFIAFDTKYFRNYSRNFFFIN